MPDWKKLLANTVTGVEDQFDQLRNDLSRRLGLDEPVTIQPYIGYGTPHVVTIKGRVLENEGVQPPSDKDSAWRNALNAYRRLESDEVAGATVLGRFNGVTETAVTGKEGYFDLTFSLPQPLPPHELWHDVALELASAPVGFEEVKKNGRILVPPASAQFGVISDIDDTVLQSSATNYLHAARLLLLRNARTRLPFAGVATFYHALQQGTGAVHNPIFYVSSSPWNVFNLLVDFFKFQDIPPGPLFLKDYGISSEQLFSSGHRSHKLAQIDTIMNTYPHLPFVLIGDSGQKDPEIYTEVVSRHPGRVKAIYIRDVSGDRRDREVNKLVQQTQTADVEMLLVADSTTAAEHAAEIGLIPQDALPAIAAGKIEEESDTVPLDEFAE